MAEEKPTLFQDQVSKPLAEMLRPKRLEDVAGQGHLLVRRQAEPYGDRRSGKRGATFTDFQRGQVRPPSPGCSPPVSVLLLSLSQR